MRKLAVVLVLLLTPILSQVIWALDVDTEGLTALPAGTIVPKHSVPETFSGKPTPIVIRIVNLAKHPVFIQGFRNEKSKAAHFFFYHREKGLKEKGRGWKPFFESLPCDHPVCQNLNAQRPPCGKLEPYVIRLAPSGTTDSVKDFVWEGLLYHKVEATMKNLERVFCYKGHAPGSGRIRIEIEYSDRAQRGRGGHWYIGGRDHTAIEFDLPVRSKVYVIQVGE